MCRSQTSAAVALLVSLCLSPLFAQGPSGDPAAPPKGLTVVVVQVGQGDATIVMGPTGKVMLFDGGPTGAGKGPVLAELRRLGAKRIDYMVDSHFHADHLGGLDEVLRRFPVTSVWDRGPRDAPTRSFPYRDYVSAAGNRRRTVSLGQVFDLGGGARARVLAYDGNVLGRSRVKIRGSRQQENAASLVLRLEYGQFSMWLGGDLTGGGNGTADVETSVAKACGDVDVFETDHHGSATSNNANLLRTIRPEVCISSNGVRNPFRHPHTDVLNRLNSRSESRLLLNTTAGYGWTGYTEAGTIRIVTDGWRYHIATSKGDAFDLYTDEHVARTPQRGDLVISEFQRNPTSTVGEYIEVTNRSGAPVSLRNLQITGNSGSFRNVAPYRLLPGQRHLFFTNGIPSKNGSLPLGHAWPFRAFSIGNASDTLRLMYGNTTVDSLSYTATLAGGRAVAAERVDLTGGSTATNFRAATTRYGTDKGTPGRRNSVDATTWPLLAGAEMLPSTTPGGAGVHLFASAFSSTNKIDVLGLAFGDRPGVQVGSVRIPLNPDVLLQASVTLPGFVAVVPAGGLRALRLDIPASTGLGGRRAFVAHFLLDPFGPRPVPLTSAAFPLTFPR